MPATKAGGHAAPADTRAAATNRRGGKAFRRWAFGPRHFSRWRKLSAQRKR